MREGLIPYMVVVGSEFAGLTAYAWPGGYRVIYVTDEGDVLCAACATEAGMDPDSERFIGTTYDEGDPVECADCGCQMDSSYGPCEEPEPERLKASKGHICWSQCLDTGLQTEWYECAGEVYAASSTNVIDIGTGYRFGRWEGTRRHFDNAVRPKLRETVL